MSPSLHFPLPLLNIKNKNKNNPSRPYEVGGSHPRQEESRGVRAKRGKSIQEREYIVERANFSKFELPLFKGQILQCLPHCNIGVGGWEFPQDSFYLLCIFLFVDIIAVCIIELFAIMLKCMCCAI